VRCHAERGAGPHTIAVPHPPKPLSLVCTCKQTTACTGYHTTKDLRISFNENAGILR
jgi:hypothetical protein